MLTGENGILTQAENAKIEQSHGAVKDALRLAYNEWQIEIKTASTTKLASKEVVMINGKEEKALANTASTFLEFLKNKGYIKEGTTDVLDVEKLTGRKQQIGNGTGNEDVYKIKETNGIYTVAYYEKENISIVIDTISNVVAEEDDNWDEIATDQKYFTFIFNEEDKTAILTGVQEKYAVKGYYNDEWFPAAIIDGDEQITDIVIPKNIKDETGNEYTVTEIADEAFYSHMSTDVKSLFTSFKLPSTIVSIGNNVFGNCVGMQNIVIPKNVKMIGDRSFYGCSKLKNVELPPYITIIGQDTFAECKLLESITIPSEVTSVMANAFYSCNALKNVTIEGDLRYIGSGAFYGCKQVKEISIQGDLQHVGDYAFGLWGADQIINFEISTKPETGWSTRWDYDYYTGSTKIEAQVNWGVSM